MEEKLLNQNKWKAKERKLLLGKLKRNQIQTVPKSWFFQQLAAQSVRRGRAVEWSCGRKNWRGQRHLFRWGNKEAFYFSEHYPQEKHCRLSENLSNNFRIDLLNAVTNSPIRLFKCETSLRNAYRYANIPPRQLRKQVEFNVFKRTITLACFNQLLSFVKTREFCNSNCVLEPSCLSEESLQRQDEGADAQTQEPTNSDSEQTDVQVKRRVSGISQITVCAWKTEQTKTWSFCGGNRWKESFKKTVRKISLVF